MGRKLWDGADRLDGSLPLSGGGGRRRFHQTQRIHHDLRNRMLLPPSKANKGISTFQKPIAKLWYGLVQVQFASAIGIPVPVLPVFRASRARWAGVFAFCSTQATSSTSVCLPLSFKKRYHPIIIAIVSTKLVNLMENIPMSSKSIKNIPSKEEREYAASFLFSQQRLHCSHAVQWSSDDTLSVHPCLGLLFFGDDGGPSNQHKNSPVSRKHS